MALSICIRSVWCFPFHCVVPFPPLLSSCFDWWISNGCNDSVNSSKQLFLSRCPSIYNIRTGANKETCSLASMWHSREGLLSLSAATAVQGLMSDSSSQPSEKTLHFLKRLWCVDEGWRRLVWRLGTAKAGHSLQTLFYWSSSSISQTSDWTWKSGIIVIVDSSAKRLFSKPGLIMDHLQTGLLLIVL